MAMTVAELEVVCGRIPLKDRANTEVRVMIGSSGARTEVKEFRVVQANGQKQLRVIAMSPLDRSRDRVKRHREETEAERRAAGETPVEPKLQVKFLKPGSGDRRKSNWGTVEQIRDGYRVDMFLAGEARSIALELVRVGPTRHARTWDPVEARVVEEFLKDDHGETFTGTDASPALPVLDPKRKVVQPPEVQVMEQALKEIDARQQHLKTVRGVKQAEMPVILKDQRRELAEAKLETQRLAARGARKKEKAVPAAEPPEERPAADPFAAVRRRHPKAAGFLWLQVSALSGAALDSRRYEYKTLDGALKGIQRLFGEPITHAQQDYPFRVWLYEGFGRRPTLLGCFYRSEENTVLPDLETEKNLGLL